MLCLCYVSCEHRCLHLLSSLPSFMHWGLWCSFCPIIFLTFFILCCDVRCDFCTNAMLGTSFPPVVCKKIHVLFILFVFAPWCDIPLDLSMNRMFCTSLAPLDCRRAPVLFMLFVFICCLVSLRIVFPIFSVSMDCPFLIAPSAFSKVYLIKYMHIVKRFI